MNQASTLPSSAALPTKTKFFYGIGQAAEGLKNDAFTLFLIPYYVLVLGLPAWMVGIATALALIFDAITDPIAGVLSDHLHSRWGRRHPYMYASAIPLGLFHFFLFAPPDSVVNDPNSWYMFGWLLTFTILTRGAVTLFHVPHLALTAELSDDYDTRTTLTGLRGMCSWLAGISSAFAGYMYFLAPTEEYPVGQLNPDAYPLFAACGGIGMVLFVFASALGTHDRIPYLKPPPKPPHWSMIWGVYVDMARTFKTQLSFALLIGVVLFSVAQFRIWQALSLPMNTYFWEFTTNQMGFFIVLYAVAAILALILARAFTAYFEKRSVFLVMGFIWCFCTPIVIVLRLLDILPENGEPMLFVIICCSILVVATMGIGQAYLVDSMMADITDEYELKTGERREGMFYSARAFLGKTGAAMGVLTAGTMLELLGIPKQAAPGSLPEETLVLMGLFDGPLVAVVALCGVILVIWYPVTRQRHADIKQQLVERAAGQGGQPTEEPQHAN